MAKKKDGKPALHMKIVSDGKDARPLNTTRPLWDQQGEETDPAYEAFWRYLNMGTERSVVAAAHELNKSRGLLYIWSGRWSWKERVRAYDKEQRERDQLARSEESQKMSDRHAQHAQLMTQALTTPALAFMRKLKESPGLMSDLLTENPDTGRVPAASLRTAFELIVRAAHALPQITGIERVARGEPQTIAEQRGDTETAGMLDPRRLISDPTSARLAGDLLARLSGADDDEGTGTEG